MEVTVFKMREEYNDYLSYEEIRNDYFDGELKKDGIYKVPKGRYEAAFNNNIILFKYQRMYIAKADKCLEYNELSKPEGKLTHYYKFNPKSISLIPPIKEEVIENLFIDKNTGQNGIVSYEIKREKEKELIKLLENGDRASLLESKEWNKYAKKLSFNSLLKEINLYNYENIHTAFFGNFIKEDNIYDLKDKPLNDFLNLLKEKNKSFRKIEKINSFEIYPQKFYKYNDSSKGIIPDISIVINNKYYIIVEAKVLSVENEYDVDDKLMKQCELYRKCFEGEKDNFVTNKDYEYFYVYLSLVSKKIENYTNVTFRDICNYIYKNYLNNKLIKQASKDILFEYLKSFQFLCDDKYKINIEDIPNISIFTDDELVKLYNNIKDDIEKIIMYEKSWKIGNSQLVNNYKYILVLLYNLPNVDKEKIKKCYELLV